MKRLLVTKENPNGTIVDFTAEEITEMENQEASPEAQGNILTEEKMQNKADLKASAKAKLIAGEALTEEEANTIVL
jgi:hypothetical protein